jgi:pimeloyl-ACP methyl ester carboxylesterase
MPFARTSDIEIHYEIRGEGPPLLLVAGTGYPGATWPEAFVEALAGHSKVIMFDHRGTGASTSGIGPYSTRMFAADATALLEGIGVDHAHVLGHSMGGRVAQWMAIDGPSTVRSLILAASGPGQYRDDRPLTRGIPVVTAEKLIEQGYEGYMASHIAATFFTDAFAADHPQVVDELVRSFWEHRPSLRDYLEHITARQQHQTAERLTEITVPCLVLVGDHDTGARGTGSHLEQSRFLADHLQDARLEVLSDTSHGYIWQTPEISAQSVLRWIAEVEAR